MKRNLRVKHAIIWHILLILVPILIALAITNIPQKATQDQLYQKPAVESEWINSEN